MPPVRGHRLELGLVWGLVLAAGPIVSACASGSIGASATPGPLRSAAGAARGSDDAVRPLLLRYEAPAACPLAATYARDVESRAGTIRVEPADSTTTPGNLLQVTLRLRDGGSRWVGEVRFEGPEALDRRVEGERCADVVAALGLITVLHFDHPDAVATAGTQVAPDAEAAHESAAGAAERGTRFDGSRMAFVARVGYASVPSHALETGLGVELGSTTSGSSWSSAFALGYARGNDSSIVGSSALTVLTTQLSVCPPGAAFDSGSWLRMCVGLRAGVLALGLSPGDRPLRTDDVLRPWLAVGPSLELGTPLSSAWTLRTLAEAGIQLVRDDFTLERAAIDRGAAARVSVYQAELASFGLSVGLAYRF